MAGRLLVVCSFFRKSHVVGPSRIVSCIVGKGRRMTLSGGVNTNGNVLAINSSGDITVSSPGISGGDGLTKAGAGTLTLGGANGYTGATPVSTAPCDHRQTDLAFRRGQRRRNFRQRSCHVGFARQLR